MRSSWGRAGDVLDVGRERAGGDCRSALARVRRSAMWRLHFDQRLHVAAAVVWSMACGGSDGFPLNGAASTAVDANASEAAAFSDAGESTNHAESGSSTNDDGASSFCDGEWLLPDSNGFVAANTNAFGITGSWYLYDDCDDFALLDAGTPIPGKNCSRIAAPAPGGPFVPTSDTSMCTSGSTAQVLADDQWPTRWGAYVGIDLNALGSVKMDFDATARGVRGFCFYVSGTFIPILRVRVPTDQDIAGRDWYQATLQHEGWHQVLFTDLKQVTPGAMPFDPSKIVSIEFEVPASRAEAIAWDFCIDALIAFR
jgi:hypothetical protein